MTPPEEMKEWWKLYETSGFDLRKLLDLLQSRSDDELNDLLLGYVRAWRTIGGNGLDDLSERMSEDNWDDFRAWLMSEPEGTWVTVSSDAAQAGHLFQEFAARIAPGRWDLDEDFEVSGHLLRKGRQRLVAQIILQVLVDIRFDEDGLFDYVQDRYYAEGEWS